MIEKDKTNLLPPRQKRILTRKPDNSLTRSHSSRKKLNSQNKTFDSSNSLSTDFTNFKQDATPQTPKKSTRNNLNIVFFPTQNKSSNSNNKFSGVNRSEILQKCPNQVDGRKGGAANIRTQQNCLESLNQLDTFTQIIKLRLQNEVLLNDNRRLKQQLDSQIQKRVKDANDKINTELVQNVKEIQQLKFQCHFMDNTIKQLEDKLSFEKAQISQFKTSYDSLQSELDSLREQKKLMQKTQGYFLQTISGLKMQSRKLSQQVRYLHISLGIKNKKQVQGKKTQKYLDVSQQLKKKNRVLRSQVMSLRQQVLIDDIFELTPEK